MNHEVTIDRERSGQAADSRRDKEFVEVGLTKLVELGQTLEDTRSGFGGTWDGGILKGFG